MASFERFEDIKAWQKARELTRLVYQACRASPVGKDFGVRNQLTRAALSVSSNIAEGFGRNSDRQFLQYLDIARGSALETQSILYCANDAELIDQARFDSLYALADEVVSMIGGLTSYLRKSLDSKGSRRRS